MGAMVCAEGLIYVTYLEGARAREKSASFISSSY